MVRLQVLIFVLLFSLIPWLSSEAQVAEEKAVAEKASATEVRVGVKGMVCAFCAQGIEKKFKAQKEVEQIKVSLEEKFVFLKFKEGQRLSNEKMAELLKEAGYEADFNR